MSGAANAVGEVIGWIVRKMRQVCFPIQHVLSFAGVGRVPFIAWPWLRSG